MTISYTTQHRRNRKRISKLIGRELKPTEEIHTHIDSSLVICENRYYHSLLHQRTRALKACGHADWLTCNYCGDYDSPDNLKIYECGARIHEECERQKRRDYADRFFKAPSYYKSHHKYIDDKRIY